MFCALDLIFIIIIIIAVKIYLCWNFFHNLTPRVRLILFFSNRLKANNRTNFLQLIVLRSHHIIANLFHIGWFDFHIILTRFKWHYRVWRRAIESQVFQLEANIFFRDTTSLWLLIAIIFKWLLFMMAVIWWWWRLGELR